MSQKLQSVVSDTNGTVGEGSKGCGIAKHGEKNIEYVLKYMQVDSHLDSYTEYDCQVFACSVTVTSQEPLRAPVYF